MDGVDYRTSPSLRITPNLRHVVELAIKARRSETEEWPDGQALIDQPERLILARHIVWRYMDEFEGRAERGKRDQDQRDQA